MTLNNLQYALLLNNRQILDRIELLKNMINSITGTDIAQLQSDLADLQSMLDQAKKDIEQISDSSITHIIQRLDDIDTTITYIKKEIQDNYTDLDDKITQLTNDLADLSQSATDIATLLTSHTENTVIHVTQDDKDLWNSILDLAKEYSKNLFDGVTSFNIEIVSELPTEDIKTMTIYFLPNLSNQQQNYYDEYMYINNSWEVISSTFIDLTPYVKQTTLDTILSDYIKITEVNTLLLDYAKKIDLDNYVKTNVLNDYAKKTDLHKHENKSILDKLSSDDNGNLLYDGNAVAQEEIPVTESEIDAAVNAAINSINE